MLIPTPPLSPCFSLASISAAPFFSQLSLFLLQLNRLSRRSYYSTYGHVEKLAEEIKKGAASVEGVEAKLWQVPETLPEEVLGKMSAPPKSDVPIITPNEFAEADGLIFGFPTRFGMMCAQFKAFFDATAGLWGTQELAGKPAGIFYSTGCQGGGLTAITQLVQQEIVLFYRLIRVRSGSESRNYRMMHSVFRRWHRN